jgi:hypothetical protein
MYLLFFSLGFEGYLLTVVFLDARYTGSGEWEGDCCLKGFL